MSLRASVIDNNNVTVISLEGRLNFENQQQLGDNISQIIKQGKQIIFDLENLSFVGSSGITSFLTELREQFEPGQSKNPIFCNVSSEFERLIDAYNNDDFFLIEKNRQDAVATFFRGGTSENN